MCPRLGDAGAVLRQCPGSENKFCCPYDGPECCEQGEYYEIDDKGIILTHGNTTITPTSSRTSSPSSPPTSSTTSSTTSSSTADGGSGTIKLGVGLGVGLGVPFLLICAAAVFILQRYQRLRVNAAPTEYSSTKGLAPAYSPPVVSPKPPAELDGKHMRPELAASEHLAQELP
ncbi:hypothetical protein BDW42DRAFT_191882 [Aspergillus taichungensis]|uniref:Mid2 domain-containing protein n=1 Tax=Aspergillus taichungensis TaxID=482145 RepID=A0A2J5I231_9EURO|nr:hypothetical protein BDW42DRAFT_191882 [Aspergillus taichungensis]